MIIFYLHRYGRHNGQDGGRERAVFMLGLNRWHVFKTFTAILCTAGLAWLALSYLVPAPPWRITIATSLPGDHYHTLGTRYQGILADSDVELQLLVTDGAKENLRLLNKGTLNNVDTRRDGN